MSVFLSPNLPANVVEIGNEISQAKINEINAGTLATQTWVTSGFAPKASPTFTGTVTIPAGASISGYLTTSSAASTYQTISGMSSYATQSYVTSQGYLTDAPSNGSEYVRKDGAWAVATGGGGGGGGISDAPSDGNLYARQNAAWASFTVPTLSVTNIDLTGNFNGYSIGSGFYTFKFDSSANTLRMQNNTGSGITISATAIEFPDSTTLSTAPTGAKSVNSQSSNYTLQLSDANQIVFLNSTGTAFTLYVPDDSTTNFAIGTIITVISNDANAIQPLWFGSPQLNNASMGGVLTNTVYQLVKVAANSWYYS